MSPSPRRRPPVPRDAIAQLPRYVAGTPALRPDGSPGFKLSSNESPFPLPDEIVRAISECAPDANRYPPSGRELAERLAARHQLPPREVTVGGGSLELLRDLLLAYAGAGTSVVFGWRSYEAYPILVQSCGARPVPVPLRQDRVDLGQLSRAISEDTRVVLLADPNNPTGTAVDPGELESFARELPPTCLLVLDQAYCEFGPAGMATLGLRLRRELANVVLLRTFSKAYALAGMRVGWCTADPEVVATLEAVALPFTLTAAAQAGARAALEADTELLRRAQVIVAERKRLTSALRELGLSVPDSQANFVWLPLGSAATQLAEACSAAGVSVRCFAGEGVRVTVGLAEENRALLEAVATYLLRRARG